MRLIVQHVEAVCGVGVGANGQGHFSVGNDLILEVQDDTSAKPARDFVFCPKQLAPTKRENRNASVDC